MRRIFKMTKQVTNNIVIENADIGFLNFSGAEQRFNPAGNRNFCVFMDVDMGQDLEAEGWNIKWFEPREEGDEPRAYLSVAVNYNNIPPKILMITSSGKTLLDEELVGMLDWADIANVDLIIRPYNWEVNGKTGVKAYVKSMYVTIEEDAFSEKYDDIPLSGMGEDSES